MSQGPAGWYVDAQGVTRWWDGTQWTEHTQPAGPPGPPMGPPTGPPTGPPGGPAGGPGGDQYAGWAGQPGAPKSGGIKPWMLIVAGVVAIGVIVAVVLVVVLGGSDEPANNASESPTDASVAAFCASFNPSRLDPSMTKSDLERIQDNMRKVGTPSDMPQDARKGWEWFVDVSNASEAKTMNQAQLSALGRYYISTCMGR